MIAVSEGEQRAILSVADALIGRAGRTSLVMALRGSRAKRVLQFEVERTKGYGYFAGMPEADVMARVDALISMRILALERNDGLPLLIYTQEGLELAERYSAEEWLEDVRQQVRVVRDGDALELPFLMSKMPQRNLSTIGKLIDLVEREADATWLPFLRAWSAAETKRIRGRLHPIITSLASGPPSPPAPS
jgi:hypothetical protein